MNFPKRVLKWSFRQLGCELKRIEPPASPYAAGSGDRLIDLLRVLKKVGYDPKTVYDIGANRGHWSAHVSQVFPAANYVLFEPQAHLENDIKQVINGRTNMQWRKAAVSDRVGTAEFVMADWDVCSRLSVALEGVEHDATTEKKVSVECTTIDEEIRRTGVTPDLLKIDAEGHDLATLDGAKSALGKTELVLVEAAVNCPTMPNTVHKVINRMHDAGYSLAGIMDLSDFPTAPGKRVSGLLWLCDLAFLLTSGRLLNKLQGPDTDFG